MEVDVHDAKKGNNVLLTCGTDIWDTMTSVLEMRYASTSGLIKNMGIGY